MFSLEMPFKMVAGRLFTIGLLVLAPLARSADLDSARQLLKTGQYADCVKMAKAAIAESLWDPEWPLLLAKAQMATGRYPAALTTVSNALDRYSPGSSMQLRLYAIDVFKANGQSEQAGELLDQLGQFASARGRNQFRPDNLVALGRAALLMGADPKLVLENFFDEALRRDPKSREACLAGGDLALAKHDFALAAKTFDAAADKFPDDPDVLLGLARAYEPSDRSQMAEALESAMDVNTNYVPAMLMLANLMIDSEDYEYAGQMLAAALEVNPWDPEAWAYRGLLAHLRNDLAGEAEARLNGLKYWKNNPLVDHLIGEKLSQKYRFQEGAARQREALRLDPKYLPAKMQLAQDLLRLGEENEGWALAEEVHEQDAYDVTAYNLTTLRETMVKFQTVTNQDFIVRMSPREASLYSDRVLALLQRAKDRLSAKYGMRLDRPTTVEIFPGQKDFGVRTFGIPDNPGFLGVCFGHVVTANSAASQGEHPANWEAVLWHEFCHVITLGLTRNKMPRWLSEGISVYEERQENPTWGQAMNPEYREMVLGKDLTPVGKLSGAFMAPKTPMHIQFAYYESSLVVEYLIKEYGFEALRKILEDLGNGVEINAAIAKRAAPMEKIESGFAAFARERAKSLAPGLDWRKPKEMAEVMSLMDDNADQPAPKPKKSAPPRLLKAPAVAGGFTNRLTWEERYGLRPSRGKSAGPETNAVAAIAAAPEKEDPADSKKPNYWGLMTGAKKAFSEKNWAEAKAPLQKLVELYPAQTGRQNAYALLAAAQRQLGETNQERETLVKLAAQSDDEPAAYLRLMELDEARSDWAGETENAQRFLAVNPLLPEPYRRLARSSEELGKTGEAARCYQRLLLLDPPDPADVHYRLAAQLRKQGDDPGAKRHVLQALEEAPRFRDAQRLLLQVSEGGSAESKPANPPPVTKP
jgi:tetratricopeptide (TPR) repeat protein